MKKIESVGTESVQNKANITKETRKAVSKKL